jgi:hypothetical protein
VYWRSIFCGLWHCVTSQKMGHLSKHKLVCGKTTALKLNVWIAGDWCTIIDITLIILVFYSLYKCIHFTVMSASHLKLTLIILHLKFLCALFAKSQVLNVSKWHKFTASIIIPVTYNFPVLILCLDLPNSPFTRVIYARPEDKHGLKVIYFADMTRLHGKV